ncbi:MAG: rod shape-determining protein MreD [Verrucomicrobiota bacterium]
MSHLIMLFSLTLAAVAQAVIPSLPWMAMTKFPFILGVVMYYALTRDRHTMLRVAFIGGLFQDALGHTPLGASSLCFCVLTGVVNHYRDLIYVRHVITHILYGGLVNLTSTLFLYLILETDGYLLTGYRWLMLRLGCSTLLGALTLPVVFHLTESLERRLGSTQARSL